ncbi:hypothetical protein [Parendozoicomonas haliclonae]|uniref:Uncharacterized protein n=1 Tax=Parendozoicomonas haliclonae TaxID=1960125 RepID=A0A1X7APL8_9GAMM|nr:hypothetical protein [Parendozoicomonas haliclonae]SMA49245.1 hypothetical protein EHSB41UT_03132 [Parendozoicomonas haliclonae]
MDLTTSFSSLVSSASGSLTAAGKQVGYTLPEDSVGSFCSAQGSFRPDDSFHSFTSDTSITDREASLATPDTSLRQSESDQEDNFRTPESSLIEGSLVEGSFTVVPKPARIPAAELIDSALATQQAIRDDLNGQAPEALLFTLPGHTILEEQYRRDPQGTRDLVAARVDALGEDIDRTFSNWWGNKRQAQTDHGHLRAALETLDEALEIGNVSPTEAFRDLLAAIRHYEATYKKESWIEKATLAFLGAANVLAGKFGEQLKTLLPAAQLEAGDAALLDPTQVPKYKDGYVFSQAHNLQQFNRKILVDHNQQVLLSKQQEMVAGFTDQDITDRTSLENKEQLVVELTRSQPAQVQQMLQDIYTYMACQHDPKIREQAAAKQAQLAAAVQNSTQNPVQLAALLNEQTVLRDTMAQRVQQLYLQNSHAKLQERMQSVLKTYEELPKAAIDELREQTRLCQVLAQNLGQWSLSESMDEYHTEFDKMAAIPLHKVLVTGQVNGEQVWHLDNTPSLAEVAKAMNPDSGHPLTPALAALQAYMAQPQGTNTQEYRAHLQLLDKQLTAQQNYLLEQAKQACGNDEAFNAILDQIAMIEQNRPLPCMLAENLTLLERGKRAGYAMLMDNEQPLGRRISTLRLEHELAKNNYNFNDEVYAMVSEIPGLAKELYGEVSQKFVDCYAGKLSSAELIGYLVKLLGSDAASGVAKMINDTLNGAAAIAEVSPETLRALQGNTEQAWANLRSAVSGTSPVFAVYNEFHARVSGETKVQYFIEALNRHGDRPTLDKLTPEQMAKVKRLVALNQLMSSGKYIPVVVDGVIRTAAGGTSPFNLVWNVGQTGLRLLATHMIDQKVNAMDGRDLKVANTALDLLYGGPAYAAFNQQVMERTSRVMADVACGKSLVRTALNASIFYPFQVLAEGLVNSYKDWRAGKPGALGKLVWNVVRMAPIVGIPAASCLSLLTVPLLGPAFIIIAATTIPGAIYLGWRWASYLAHHTGLVDIGILAMERAREWAADPAINLDQYIDEAFAESGYRNHIHAVAQNRAYAELGEQEWDSFVADHPDLAANIMQEVELNLAKDQSYLQDVTRLQNMAATLRALETIDPGKVTLDELKQLLPAEDAAYLPKTAEGRDLEFWIRTAQDTLRAELAIHLGTTTIPVDDQAVADQLARFYTNRQKGLYIANEGKAGKALARLTVKQEDEMLADTHTRMKERLDGELVKAMQKLMTNRAQASQNRVNGQMRKDQFEHDLSQDGGLKDAMKQELTAIMTSEMAMATKQNRKRLQHQFRAHGLNMDKGTIDKLMGAAAAAAA